MAAISTSTRGLFLLLQIKPTSNNPPVTVPLLTHKRPSLPPIYYQPYPTAATTMTTEYYQIPSQQGLLPLSSTSPDPWLASATSSFSSLSLESWGVKSSPKASLFEPGTADALSWKHVVPMHTAGTKAEVQAPNVPRQFHSTTSKIDAWSVVDNVVNNKQQPNKRNTKPQPSPQLPAASSLTASTDDKPLEDELSHQNISFIFLYSFTHIHSLIFILYLVLFSLISLTDTRPSYANLSQRLVSADMA